jgi:D-beta-D-heptose 7-phosphate kinase/D-beta-D-heptose 1-phosphate adenosyltransferase
MCLLSIVNTSPVNILVIGDLILDRYIQGQVKRISPEAPVPVLFQTGDREVLGGAGNVANNICSLGGACSLVGVLGADKAGQSFIQLANEAGITISPIIDNERKTSEKTRLMGGQQQLLRVDNETLSEISNKIEQQLLDVIYAVEEEVRDPSMMVCPRLLSSNYKIIRFSLFLL